MMIKLKSRSNLPDRRLLTCLTLPSKDSQSSKYLLKAILECSLSGVAPQPLIAAYQAGQYVKPDIRGLVRREQMTR